MLRCFFPWPSLAALGVMASVACLPGRIEPNSEEELTCAAMVRCWYPDDQGSMFDEAGPAWLGMADDDNEQNIRRAYGTNGTCWQKDPMAGTEVEGEVVEEGALAASCGQACACAIIDLCDKQGLATNAAPDCAPGAADPCVDRDALEAMCQG